MCQINIPFSGSAESLLQRAKTEIEKTGGTFTGGSSLGNFQAKTPIGTIHGSYLIREQEMVLSIAKKPLLLSCKRIEKELKSVIQ